MEEMVFLASEEFVNKLAEWGILLLKIVLIFLACKVSLVILNKVIDAVIKGGKALNRGASDQKYKTVKAVLKNVAKYTIYFFGIVIALDLLGFPVASVITAAGVGGVAIAFGAQSLVKDVITGLFILFEDQYAVGDYIDVAGVSGTVTEVGLRVTKLSDFDGKLHMIPNGSISTVTNYSRQASRVLVEIGIAYEEDIDRAVLVLKEVCEKVNESFRSLITKDLEVLGVSGFGASDITLTVLGYAEPMQHFAVERAVRKSMKEAFDEHHIEIPYQKQVIYMEGGNT